MQRARLPNDIYHLFSNRNCPALVPSSRMHVTFRSSSSSSSSFFRACIKGRDDESGTCAPTRLAKWSSSKFHQTRVCHLAHFSGQACTISSLLRHVTTTPLHLRSIKTLSDEPSLLLRQPWHRLLTSSDVFTTLHELGVKVWLFSTTKFSIRLSRYSRWT